MKRAFYYFLSALIAIILSSVGYFFSTGFNTIWFAIWLAPIPLLMFSYYRSVPTTFLVAFIVGMLGWASLLNYTQTLLPWQLVIWPWLANALIFAALIVVNRALVKRIHNCIAIFVYPCLVVLIEFLTAQYSSAGTLGSIAYTQFGNEPIVQLASLTGIWGISFVATLLPAAVSVGWYLRKNPDQAGLSLLFMLIIVGSVIGFGIYRIHNSQASDKKVTVGLAALPTTAKQLLSTKQSNVLKTAGQYKKLVAELAQQGAKIVVLPEKIVAVTPEDFNQTKAVFAQAAKQNNVLLIVGVRYVLSGEKANLAWVFGRQGTLLTTYEKHHLVPSVEAGYQQGTTLTTLMTQRGAVGVAICKDADFINPARTYSQAGVGLLLVPALDFKIDSWVHAKPAIFRGIEGGYSVVRAAQWGLLSVTDAQGEVIGVKKTNDKTPATLVTKVTIGQGKSYYAQQGNWFLWGVSGLFVFLLLYWEHKRGRRKR